MNAQFRAAARQYESQCDCCGPSTDIEDDRIAELVAEAGIDDTMMCAAIFAVRNNDFGYLQNQYRRLVEPLIDADLA